MFYSNQCNPASNNVLAESMSWGQNREQLRQTFLLYSGVGEKRTIQIYCGENRNV